MAKKTVKKKGSKKKVKREEKYVQLCPICGNREFSFFSGDRVTNIVGRELYECHRCANIFSFPVEMPLSKANKIKLAPLTEKLKDNTPNSAYISLGRFEVGIYWKILGVAMILIGLAFMFVSTYSALCYKELGQVICVTNSNPLYFIFIGLANLFAGFYLIFESFIVFRTEHQLSRTIKILLVFGLLLVIYLVGYPFIFYLPFP